MKFPPHSKLAPDDKLKRERERYYSNLAEKEFSIPFTDETTARKWLRYTWDDKRGYYTPWRMVRWLRVIRDVLRGETNPYA